MQFRCVAPGIPCTPSPQQRSATTMHATSLPSSVLFLATGVTYVPSSRTVRACRSRTSQATRRPTDMACHALPAQHGTSKRSSTTAPRSCGVYGHDTLSFGRKALRADAGPRWCSIRTIQVPKATTALSSCHDDPLIMPLCCRNIAISYEFMMQRFRLWEPSDDGFVGACTGDCNGSDLFP